MEEYSDYSQDNSVMNFIGFSSGSTIIDIANYLAVGLCIVFAEMLIFKFYKFKYKNSYQKKFNSNHIVFKTASRLKSWMPFGAPLRYLMLGVVLINTAGFDELKNYSDSSHRWSWWLTLFLLFVVTFIFGCTVLYVILSRDYQVLTESNVFCELVNGLKSNRVSKLYSFIFMTHRILIILLMVDMNINTNGKVICLMWIQLIYIIILIIIRPFCSLIANMTKIIWEISLLIFLWLALAYSESQNWSDSTPYIFIWLMCTSWLISCLLSFGNF